MQKRTHNKKNKTINRKKRIEKFKSSLTEENRNIYKKRLNIEHTNKKVGAAKMMCICVQQMNI